MTKINNAYKKQLKDLFLFCGNNIKMELSVAGYEAIDWTEVSQDAAQWQAFVSSVMRFQGPQEQECLPEAK